MVTKYVRKAILAAMGAGYVAKETMDKAIREIKRGGFSESEARSALREAIKDAKDAGRRLERGLEKGTDAMLHEWKRKKR